MPALIEDELRVLAVPEGVSELRIAYRPPGLIAGAVISVATALGVLGAWRRVRRKALT